MSQPIERQFTHAELSRPQPEQPMLTAWREAGDVCLHKITLARGYGLAYLGAYGVQTILETTAPEDRLFMTQVLNADSRGRFVLRKKDGDSDDLYQVQAAFKKKRNNTTVSIKKYIVVEQAQLVENGSFKVATRSLLTGEVERLSEVIARARLTTIQL